MLDEDENEFTPCGRLSEVLMIELLLALKLPLPLPLPWLLLLLW